MFLGLPKTIATLEFQSIRPNQNKKYVNYIWVIASRTDFRYFSWGGAFIRGGAAAKLRSENPSTYCVLMQYAT